MALPAVRRTQSITIDNGYMVNNNNTCLKLTWRASCSYSAGGGKAPRAAPPMKSPSASPKSPAAAAGPNHIYRSSEPELNRTGWLVSLYLIYVSLSILYIYLYSYLFISPKCNRRRTRPKCPVSTKRAKIQQLKGLITSFKKDWITATKGINYSNKEE